MKYKSLKGTQDILEPDIENWLYVEELARKVFKGFGYSEIRTPIIENTELFKKSIGQATDIVGKEMFSFKDKAGRSITLRPEETASVVRAYLENNLDKTGNLSRFFYLGPMFRSERPQAGRYRQFHQLGVEAIGSYSPYLDIEIIQAMNALIEELGLKNCQIVLNTLGSAEDRKEYTRALKRTLSSRQLGINKFCPDCRRRYKLNPLRMLDCKKPGCTKLRSQLPKPADNISKDAAEHHQIVKDGLRKLGIKFKEDPYLVRGLDYYTKTTFELIHHGLGAQNAVCAGGRYDGLVESFGGKPAGACGFAFGLERLLIALQKEGIDFKHTGRNIIYIATMDNPALKKGLGIAAALRKKGLAVVLDYEDKSLKAQLRQANKIGAGYVIMIGEDELKSKTVTLKDMQAHSQQTVKEKDIAQLLLKQISK